MNKFVINTKKSKVDSINRTIRIKAECFDRLMELSEKSGISFNNLINQCLDYAMANLDESNLGK